MLRVDEDDRMFFLHNELLLYFSNAHGIEKPDKYGQKCLTLLNTKAGSTCCNVSLNIIITQ